LLSSADTYHLIGCWSLAATKKPRPIYFSLQGPPAMVARRPFHENRIRLEGEIDLSGRLWIEDAVHGLQQSPFEARQVAFRIYV
jgi:hypothetical protein